MLCCAGVGCVVAFCVGVGAGAAFLKKLRNRFMDLVTLRYLEFSVYRQTVTESHMLSP